MMKKFFVAASVALLALAGCNRGGGSKEASSLDSTVYRAPSSQIAYVNIDSLVNAYDLYFDLRTAYEKKVKKVDDDLTSKGRSLEKQVADYQDKAQKGLLTRSQMADTEQSLQQQQESFVRQRETAMRDLAEEEQVLMKRILNNIDEFLKEFNADYRYGMILSTAGGSPVLHADPQLDITSVVLKALNERYIAERAKTKKQPESGQ